MNAPTSLDGTTVTIGGKAAFIDYISPGQVNALVASDTPLGVQQVDGEDRSRYERRIRHHREFRPAGTSRTFVFPDRRKAICRGVVPDGTYVLPVGAISGVASRPAKPGDTIVLYGVGFGPVMPNIPAGQIVGQSNALSSSLQMSIGGMLATALYSGLAPNYTGLYQFNVVAPSVGNGALPLAFTLGGTASTQTLYFAAQN